MERRKILSLIIILMFLSLAGGLLNLDILQGAKFRRLSDSNCIRLISQSGSRGNILDRNGEVIVNNRISYDVMIMPQDMDRLDEELDLIGRILGTGAKGLKAEFKKNFLSSSIPVTVATNIKSTEAILLGEYKADYPSIIVTPKPLRNYPCGSLASHLIGYLNEIDRWRLTKLEDYGYKTKDIVGFGGVEEKYDYYLRQEEGGLSVEVNHRGKITRVLGFEPPRNGRDVQLTLDIRIQKIVEDSLRGRKGSVVLMDPRTGEILALANYPDFNPSAFVNKRSREISGLFNNPDSPLVNRAIASAYPPASVFKLVVASAGLETKKINSSTRFFCDGSMMVGRRRFKCWARHGSEDIFQAIAHSCDIFFYRTGLLLGAQNIHDYALRLGLGKPPGFDLEGETAGYIPSPLKRKLNNFRSWFDGDTANFSIGQGDCLASPMQITVMLAVFANRGWLVAPHVVKAVGDVEIASRKRRFNAVPFRKETFDVVRRGLSRVVSDPEGTGNALAGLPVKVSGKTGTAQVSRGATHAWFAGFFPSDEPKYVICVFLENGGPGHAACQLAGKIIEAMSAQGLI
ncbi:MAG: penicillin-binding protein 2 [Candidatus Omnitrophica bacterium]|jgi:penicillin-binding protein 2|nr:penicillin-binding protein 2 [Candidatus Omnitrophota bacterium]MDD3274174.1 penicillin-binding protein 2 [Candidatus Omnitrophota bacterium]MDD5077508.1 penicillin-binding protein 2 [Candidatus Omnitrophota bacterium]